LMKSPVFGFSPPRSANSMDELIFFAGIAWIGAG